MLPFFPELSWNPIFHKKTSESLTYNFKLFVANVFLFEHRFLPIINRRSGSMGLVWIRRSRQQLHHISQSSPSIWRQTSFLGVWFHIFFVFIPKIVEMIQFDSYIFANGLVKKPPTSFLIHGNLKGTLRCPKPPPPPKCYPLIFSKKIGPTPSFWREFFQVDFPPSPHPEESASVVGVGESQDWSWWDVFSLNFMKCVALKIPGFPNCCLIIENKISKVLNVERLHFLKHSHWCAFDLGMFATLGGFQLRWIWKPREK